MLVNHECRVMRYTLTLVGKQAGSEVPDACFPLNFLLKERAFFHMTQKTIWLALTCDDASGELDASAHASEDDAKSAIMNELHELYGELFNDDPPPDEYDPEIISNWISDNMIKFSWSVRPKTLPKDFS